MALAIPFAVLLTLLSWHELDDKLEFFNADLHFYIVSVAALLSAAIAGALVLSARSIRETRVLFLALCFFSLTLIFAVHGLTTPGHFIHHQSAALERSPWLATLVASSFAAASVVNLPVVGLRSRLRLPELIFSVFALAIVAYFAISLKYPDWLKGFPTTAEWFQHTLTVITLSLLFFAAWRYFQTYLFARLPGQLAIVVSLLFLAEAQISLDFGEVYYGSWWLYHFLFLFAFIAVLLGWGLEVRRARDTRAIADALVMRDAVGQLKRGYAASLVSLADQIEAHDVATLHHVDRVAAYAYAIGKELGMQPARLRDLALSAQMHDIGKLKLPPYILKKADKLTDEEFGLIRMHPVDGWDIVTKLANMDTIAKVVRHHHENYDGGGYPDGLKGEAIPLEARIISTADTFDALTSDRPYRPAFTVDAAKAELQRVSGSQLDPVCVRALLKALESPALANNVPSHADEEHNHIHSPMRPLPMGGAGS